MGKIFRIIILLIIFLLTSLYLCFAIQIKSFNVKSAICLNAKSEQVPAVGDGSEESEDKCNYDARQITSDMKVGWNLGNTLDRRDGKNRRVEDFETAKEYTDFYENLSTAIATEDTIKTVKDAGFNAIRLPVTWRDHVYRLDENGNKIKDTELYDLNIEEIEQLKIEPVWLDRVEEVVHYIIDNDMYCIMNAHSDVGAEKLYRGNYIKPWIYATTDEVKKAKYEKSLEVLWTQISERFKDYGANLLFEGFNEIRIDKVQPADNLIGSGFRAEYENGSVTVEHLQAVNDLNQVFVNSVRSTGGNNERRFLVVNTYLAELCDRSLKYFEVPQDTIENHLILEVHYYDHYATYADDNEDKKSKDSTFYKLSILKKRADELGIPAIMGEFNSYMNDQDNIPQEKVALSQNYYLRMAKKLGITCFLWDDAGERYGHLKERIKTLNEDEESENQSPWLYPKVIEAIIKGSKGETIEDIVANFEQYNKVEKEGIKYICDIQPSTNIETIREQLQTNGVAKMYKGNDIFQDENMNVFTGMNLLVSIENESINYNKEYVTVIRGDISGDGKADLRDILLINKHRLGKVLLNSPYILAGDVNDDNVVDISDIMKINKYRLGKNSIL